MTARRNRKPAQPTTPATAETPAITDRIDAAIEAAEAPATAEAPAPKPRPRRRSAATTPAAPAAEAPAVEAPAQAEPETVPIAEVMAEVAKTFADTKAAEAAQADAADAEPPYAVGDFVKPSTVSEPFEVGAGTVIDVERDALGFWAVEVSYFDGTSKTYPAAALTMVAESEAAAWAALDVYTVFGLVDRAGNDGKGQLLVVAVVKEDMDALDSRWFTGTGEQFQRFCHRVRAASADEAEQMCLDYDRTFQDQVA